MWHIPLNLLIKPFKKFVYLVLILACLLSSLDIDQLKAQNNITIQGVLTNELDRPITEARVTITTQGFTQSILSQSDGKYSIQIPHLGTYTLTAKAEGYRPVHQQITISKLEDSPPVLSFKLLPTSLHITLLDVKTGVPLSGGIVTVKSQNDEIARRAIDLGNGEYYFGRLASGIYEMNVAITGYETHVIERVLVNTNNTTEQIVPLARISIIPIGEKQKDRSFVSPRLPSNQVLDVYSDFDGSIWFCTKSGVCHYNGKDFESSDRTDIPLSTLSKLRVNTVLRSNTDSSLWFATEHGVFVQKPQSRTLDLIEPMSKLPSLEVTSICQTQDGTIWLGTIHGVASWSNGVLKFWDKSYQFTNSRVNWLFESKSTKELWAATEDGLFKFNKTWILMDLKNAGGLPLSNVHCVEERENGDLWLATNDGLYELHEGVALLVNIVGLKISIRKCVRDGFGNLWCTKKEQGIIVYSPSLQETAERLTSDKVHSITLDQEGQLWFGTNAGAIKHDAFSFVTFDTSRGLLDSDIRSIAFDSHTNHLWIGTAHTVQEFDGVKFNLLKEIPENIIVRQLLVQSDGTLLIATNIGLYIWNKAKLLKVEIQGTLPIDIRGIVVDIKRPILWITTTNSIVPLNLFTMKPEGEIVRIDGEVRFLTQVSSGYLWVATNKGAYSYNPTTAELVIIGTAQGLESLDVRWIQEQPSEGKLWIVTGHGIESYDGVRIQPDFFSTATKGTDVRCLFVDMDKYLWIGLGDGSIRKFFLQTPELSRVYKREEYDITGTQIRSIVQGHGKTMWFATEMGLTRHIPNIIAPKIEAHLEVDGVEIQQPFPIDISAGKHYVKFKFTGISSMGNVGYQYCLNDGTSIWKTLSSDQLTKNEVAFPDLSAGEYIFELKAISRDLYGWDATPNSFVIRINQPVYTKKWFLFFGITFIVSGGGGVWFIRKRQRREYVLPPHLKIFKPIESNPFIVGNPIRHPGMFFGREDDFQYVRKKLESTAQGLVIVLCGERRTGKSSILYQIQNGRLGEKFVPVFVDLQEMVVDNDREFFSRLAYLIVESINRFPNLSVNRLNLDSYKFTDLEKNPFDIFRKFIDSVLGLIGNRLLVMLVDEYELLETKVQNKKLDREIFQFLAGLLSSHDRLSMIFTGSKKIEQRDRRYWREMLRRSLFRKIGYLSERDTERLVSEPVKDQLVYGRGVVQKIYRLTAGQPFYTQVICQNIVDYLNEHKRNYVLRSDIQYIISEIINNPLPQMIYFWEGLSDDEKLILSLLAEILVDDSKFATASRLANIIVRNNYPVTLSENTIRLTLEELFRQELLVKNNDGGFSYRLDLMRYWIKQSHSIWQVVREVKTL